MCIRDSAEIAICLLMCATDAASEGDRNEATRLTLLARDLVGAPACEALIRLIRESDEELARERGAAPAEAGRDAGASSDAREGEEPWPTDSPASRAARRS